MNESLEVLVSSLGMGTVLSERQVSWKSWLRRSCAGHVEALGGLLGCWGSDRLHGGKEAK